MIKKLIKLGIPDIAAADIANVIEEGGGLIKTSYVKYLRMLENRGYIRLINSETFDTPDGYSDYIIIKEKEI